MILIYFIYSNFSIFDINTKSYPAGNLLFWSKNKKGLFTFISYIISSIGLPDPSLLISIAVTAAASHPSSKTFNLLISQY